MFPHFDWDFPKMYAGSTDVKNPLISPLYADLRGLPPLFIMAGDHEIIRDDSTRLAKRARAAGVSETLEIWPDMWHVWMFFAPWMPEANRAMRRLGQVIQNTRREHAKQTK
jgi:acetyl esterase/lipase